MSIYKGDLDRNGKVDVNDAQYILNWISSGGNMQNLGPLTYSINNQQYSMNNIQLSDMDGNGKVDVNDAQYILNWISSGGNMDNLGPLTYSINNQQYSITILPPLTITTISMPNTNTDPVSSWIANQLSLDFTNTDISSTHLLACEFDISGDLTNSILNPYTDDLKPSGTEVTSGTAFDGTFDSYITFGAWSKNAEQGYIEPTYILPTNTFDSSVTNDSQYIDNLLTTNGVKHLLWAPPGGTLKPTNNNFPISQIIIADSVNDATFSFVYGKGVLGNNDSNGLAQGRIFNGTISAGVMTVTNYE